MYTRERKDSTGTFFLPLLIFIHSPDCNRWIRQVHYIKRFYLWVHMLNLKINKVREKSCEALAIPEHLLRGSAPTLGGFMAAGKQFGVVFVVVLSIIASVAAGNVDFKHHNNTEMAEVLQQVHNR